MDIIAKKSSSRSILIILILVSGLLVSGLFKDDGIKPTDVSSEIFKLDTSLSVLSSVESGIDILPVSLSLSSNEGVIHYSLGNSDPGLNSQIYERPLSLTAENGNTLAEIPTSPRWMRPRRKFKKGVILKAAVYTPDGKRSPVTVRSFINREEGSSLPVISLVCDSQDLFGYERGIYVMGKAYEDKDNYVRKHVNLDRSWWYYPGNYQSRGSNSIRPCYIEDLSQRTTAGSGFVRIHGNATRGFSQKSLRIKYKPSGKRDSVTIILRNSGNDFTRSLVRDALSTSIVGQASDIPVSFPSPYSIYINGEYWGIQWKSERVDHHFISKHLEIDPDSLSIIDFPGGVLHGKEKANKELKNFLASLEENIVQADPYNKVNESVDVEQFIDYILLELFLGNTDWPSNNVRIWRSESSDTRWKFLVYDLDYTFGYSTGGDHDPFPVLENNNVPGKIYKALAKDPKFASRIVERYKELTSDVLSSKNLEHKLDSITAVISNDIRSHIDRWRYPESLSRWRSSVEQVRAFAANRDKYFSRYLEASLKRLQYSNPKAH